MYKNVYKFSFGNKSYSKYKYVTHLFVAFLSERNIDSLFKARTMLIPLRYAASQYAYQERAQYFWKSPFTLFSSRHFKTQDSTYCLNVSSVFQVRVINATINRSFSQLTEVYVNCNLVKSNINQIVVKLLSSHIYIYIYFECAMIITYDNHLSYILIVIIILPNCEQLTVKVQCGNNEVK